MTDEELNKKKEEIIKHDRDSITNRIRHSFNCGFDMGREYAKEHQKVVYKTKYVYADGVEIEPTEDGRYTGCSNCKYVDKGLNVCQAMLCKHSIDKLYERFEPKQKQPERDCINCVNSKDGHMDFSETCHNCMWENQFIPKRINVSDIKFDNE